MNWFLHLLLSGLVQLTPSCEAELKRENQFLFITTLKGSENVVRMRWERFLLIIRPEYDYSRMQGRLSLFPSVRGLAESSRGSFLETACLLWSLEPGQRG